jgi:peptidoglycan-associated lipoprotein
MRQAPFRITVTGIALAAACHGAPQLKAPAPHPTDAEVSLQRHHQDSLAAADRATADSVERARQLELAERARGDSVERVRIAADAASREAAEKNAAPQAELETLVHFAVARAVIQADDATALERKVAILNANPTVRLRITGACDERGSERYNMALGRRRAAAVKRYLVSKGISTVRLEEASTGESSPIEPGSTEIAWAKNRRAEFLILGGTTPLAVK